MWNLFENILNIDWIEEKKWHVSEEKKKHFFLLTLDKSFFTQHATKLKIFHISDSCWKMMLMMMMMMMRSPNPEENDSNLIIANILEVTKSNMTLAIFFPKSGNDPFKKRLKENITLLERSSGKRNYKKFKTEGVNRF